MKNSEVKFLMKIIFRKIPEKLNWNPAITYGGKFSYLDIRKPEEISMVVSSDKILGNPKKLAEIFRKEKSAQVGSIFDAGKNLFEIPTNRHCDSTGRSFNERLPFRTVERMRFWCSVTRKRKTEGEIELQENYNHSRIIRMQQWKYLHNFL